MNNNKYIWAVGALFAIALIVGSAGIISAAWQAPSQAFPNQNIAPPIDTGPSFQTKSQGIGFDPSFVGPALTFQKEQAINTTGAPFTFIPATGFSNNTVMQSSGAFYMNTRGVVLPREETSGLNATKGMITYSPSQDKVKVYTNSGWVDIGTGTGILGIAAARVGSRTRSGNGGVHCLNY